MAIAQVTAVAQLLTRMRETAQAAGLDIGTGIEGGNLGGVRAAGSDGVSSFATELAKSLKQVSVQQDAAYRQAQAYELGDPKVALNDVMLDMQKASLGFQMTVQVRNRLVAAYQEIASMAV